MTSTKIKDFVPGTSLRAGEMKFEAKKTTPPARYSEAALLGALEEKNIGRPSTYSSIISVIQERGYVRKEGKQLVPTFLGFAVARLLALKFPEYTSYDYTSKMEDQLDEIAAGKVKRVDFLNDFWNGNADREGFFQIVEYLKKNIDYNEIKELSTIQLGNGYSVHFNKFGSFLQDEKAGKDADGRYVKSARIDDDALLDPYLDPEFCAKVIAEYVNKPDAKVLGVLSSGPYAGYEVTARSGRFGAYIQAVEQNVSKSKKPQSVNMTIPENLSVDTISLLDAEDMLKEIKLPRDLSPKLKVGIGKRGPWIGFKATPKGRMTFISLPDNLDPRTMSLDEGEKVWNDHQAEKANKAAVKKTTKDTGTSSARRSSATSTTGSKSSTTRKNTTRTAVARKTPDKK